MSIQAVQATKGLTNATKLTSDFPRCEEFLRNLSTPSAGCAGRPTRGLQIWHDCGGMTEIALRPAALGDSLSRCGFGCHGGDGF